MNNEQIERVAKALCAETCAFAGEPPCYSVEGDWPNPGCDEPGCHTLAARAIAAMQPNAQAGGRPQDYLRVSGTAEIETIRGSMDLLGRSVKRGDRWLYSGARGGLVCTAPGIVGAGAMLREFNCIGENTDD